VRSIRVFAKKNLGNPYYEPTIVVHDTALYTLTILLNGLKDLL